MPETKLTEDTKAGQPAAVVADAKPKGIDMTHLDQESLNALVKEIVTQTRAADKAAAEAEAKAAEPHHEALSPTGRFLTHMLSIPRNKFVKPILEAIAKDGVKYASNTGLTLAATFTLQAIRPDAPMENLAVGTMIGGLGAKVAEPIAKAMVEFGDHILGKGIDAIQRHQDGRAEKLLTAQAEIEAEKASAALSAPAANNLVVMDAPKTPTAPKTTVRLQA